MCYCNWLNVMMWNPNSVFYYIYSFSPKHNQLEDTPLWVYAMHIEAVAVLGYHLGCILFLFYYTI